MEEGEEGLDVVGEDCADVDDEVDAVNWEDVNGEAVRGRGMLCALRKEVEERATGSCCLGLARLRAATGARASVGDDSLAMQGIDEVRARLEAMVLPGVEEKLILVEDRIE